MHRVKLIELAPHFQCLRVNDPRNSDGAVEVAAWRASGPLAEVSVAVIDPDDKLFVASMCSRSRDRQVLISYPPLRSDDLR
jgi:hypothetical protein